MTLRYQVCTVLCVCMMGSAVVYIILYYFNQRCSASSSFPLFLEWWKGSTPVKEVVWLDTCTELRGM